MLNKITDPSETRSHIQNHANFFNYYGTKEVTPNMNVGVDMFRSDERCTQDSIDPLDTHAGPEILSEDKPLLFQEQKSRNIHWTVSWSDLMMTMFIFFLVLYLYQSANKEFVFGKSGEKFSHSKEDIAGGTDQFNIYQSSDSEIKSLPGDFQEDTLIVKSPEDILDVDLERDRAVRIILPGDLLFESGKAVLKPGAKKSLGDIAEIIKKTSYMVNVVGHSDNVPLRSDIYPTNWELSALRACSVARFLIEDMDVPDGRFFISGYSYHVPLKPNNSAKNRAANRRVEIILTKEKPFGEYRRIEIY